MAKSLYQNVNGTLVPISYQPFVSMTQAELDEFVRSGKRHPEGTIVHVTDGTNNGLKAQKVQLFSKKTFASNETQSNPIAIPSDVKELYGITLVTDDQNYFTTGLACINDVWYYTLKNVSNMSLYTSLSAIYLYR